MAKALGPGPSIHPTARVLRSRLGAYTEVGPRTSLLETAWATGHSCIVNDGEAAYATVGKFCSIAAQARLKPGDHPTRRASQSHLTYRAGAYWPGQEEDEAAFFDWRRSTTATLGHDVWIGHGVVVLPGRSVGTGALAGAGAAVTRDVPPYAVAVGNPARVVRHRFAPPAAERLMAPAWWDWEHGRLRSALPDFRALSAEAFLDKHRG